MKYDALVFIFKLPFAIFMAYQGAFHKSRHSIRQHYKGRVLRCLAAA